eukprot:gnl/MRDRNA2_/MRDRNA2_238228_c0_seq1.p1 gnl/MRDRNA2_/MRDRNA2_238228_c0~~gnl/MRDRNA2_/MRDRNA2_238228_c0_seq1.p1  ORF type:complete len:433 (+),score=89.80 gnl/MRDRNA2_/MRDRNA2_238228_c0_seq1:78-1301(+)
MPPADLTPAVEKYAGLPVGDDSEAEMILRATGPKPKGPDPFKLAEKDLQALSDGLKADIQQLTDSENPTFTVAASNFYRKRQGKRVRPTIVALVGQALAPGGRAEDVVARQTQLGQIAEIIHGASLIHDDVLEDAEIKDAEQAVPDGQLVPDGKLLDDATLKELPGSIRQKLSNLPPEKRFQYTNKVAVLAGDYLLSRAAVLLAKLQHSQVVEVMASALEALVQGEIMDTLGTKADLRDMNYYLRKSYFKTGALICNSCKATALLAGFDENDDMTKTAEEFGYHLGMTYTMIGDILEFKDALASVEKTAQADIRLSHSIAPFLFASEVETSLQPLIEGRFKGDGDIQKAVALAKDTDCLEKSYQLAEFHAQKGVDALMKFPESEHRQALLVLMHMILSRTSVNSLDR